MEDTQSGGVIIAPGGRCVEVKLSLSVVLKSTGRTADSDNALRGKKFRTWLSWSLLGLFFKIGMFVLKSTPDEILWLRPSPHPHDTRDSEGI